MLIILFSLEWDIRCLFKVIKNCMECVCFCVLLYSLSLMCSQIISSSRMNEHDFYKLNPEDAVVESNYLQYIN